MEENKKSSKVQKIVFCIVVGLLIFNLIEIANLNSRIERLSTENSRLSSDINMLNSSINSIYSNVDEQLKKQASIISSVDYSIGKPGENMKIVPVSLEVVPKLLTDDMKVSVTIDNTTVDLERKGNKFAGSTDVDLFIKYDVHPLLTVETAEGTKTEYLEDVDISYQFSNYLPALDADMNSNSRTSNGIMNIDSYLTIYAKNRSDVTFTSFEIVEVLNGEEISRKDITDEVMQADGIFEYDYSRSLEISGEYDFRVYVVAEDSLGYIHKDLANCWKNSIMDAKVETILNDVAIYDKDGNALYYNEYEY